MGIFDDPAKWMVAGLVALVHLTVVLLRRNPLPFRWQGLAVSFAPLLCCVWPMMVFVGVGSVGPPLPVVPFYVPLLCSALLASKMRDNKVSIYVSLAGLFTAFTFYVGVLPLFLGTYTLSYERWNGIAPSFAVNKIRGLGYGREPPAHKVKSPKPTGFVRNWASKLPPEFDFDPTDRFALSVGEPLWHTPITGLLRRRVHYYRLWTPGGLPEKMADEARLVEVDESGEPLTPGSHGRRADEFTLADDYARGAY